MRTATEMGQEKKINWRIESDIPHERELAITLECEQYATEEKPVRIGITIPNQDDLALLMEALRFGKRKIQFVVTLEDEEVDEGEE